MANFAPVPLDLQFRIRAALNVFSQYANLTFTEVTESNTTHADIRFGMSDMTGDGLDRRAEAYSIDESEHDVWFQTGSSDWSDPTKVVPGSFSWLGLMHEIGHAIGFAHSTDRLTPSHEGWDYSIMDYKPFPGAVLPFTEPLNFYPATPMITDVAALQYLYGANFNTNNTDTVYRWDRNTGQEFINGVAQPAGGNTGIYMTLWDGGGYRYLRLFENVREYACRS